MQLTLNTEETKTSHFAWLSHILPIVATLLAVAMLVLTPVWAMNYYHQPFAGVLLEPNNVVSKIIGKDWPASQAGAAWPDQLVKLGNQPVKNVEQVNTFLASNGNAAVPMEFLDRSGAARNVLVAPIQMPLGNFINLFIIPYLVGLVFLVIGLWAYYLRGGLRASRALLIFASAVSIVSSTFFDMNTTHHVVLLWAISLSVAASALIHLALVFPQQMSLVNRWPVTRFIAWVFCLAFAIPVISEIENSHFRAGVYRHLAVQLCLHGLCHGLVPGIPGLAYRAQRFTGGPPAKPCDHLRGNPFVRTDDDLLSPADCLQQYPAGI